MAKLPQGIQSADAALRVVNAIAGVSRAMSLKEIAAAAQMTASNTHRYMVSLSRAGMVRQESETGRYDLGPLALRLGLAALSRLDAFDAASRAMVQLRAEIDMPVFLSIWTAEGPIMIRWLDASHALTVTVKPGSRAPLLTAASGRIFLSYEDPERVRAVLVTELRARKARKASVLVTMDDVRQLQQTVRSHGLANVLGERFQSVNGLSAPIFDTFGALAMSITSVGLDHVFDAAYDGRFAEAIRAAAARASIDLGYHAPTARRLRLHPSGHTGKEH